MTIPVLYFIVTVYWLACYSPLRNWRSPAAFVSRTSQAIGRLTPRESYDRVHRLRVVHQLSILHTALPKEQWLDPKEVRLSSLRACAEHLLTGTVPFRMFATFHPLSKKSTRVSWSVSSGTPWMSRCRSRNSGRNHHKNACSIETWSIHTDTSA